VDAEDDLVVAVTFDPPGAGKRFKEWRVQYAAMLADLADNEIRIDVGRAVGRDFVRVWLPSELARRVGRDS
jgi:hypothetical protein